jgi:predicted ribosome quality control (RQC) complex YloA/Tae2 family protein
MFFTTLERTHRPILKASPDDIWFHVNGKPSEHIVMQVLQLWDKKQKRDAITQDALLCSTVQVQKRKRLGNCLY